MAKDLFHINQSFAENLSDVLVRGNYSFLNGMHAKYTFILFLVIAKSFIRNVTVICIFYNRISSFTNMALDSV